MSTYASTAAVANVVPADDAILYQSALQGTAFAGTFPGVTKGGWYQITIYAQEARSSTSAAPHARETGALSRALTCGRI